MCRCADPHDTFPIRRALQIRAFHLRLLTSEAPFSLEREALTLVYLPGWGRLKVNDSRIRPGAPALVPLHRFRSAERSLGEIVFASSDRIVAGEGQRFEVYAGDRLVLSGAFRMKEEEGDGWGLELRGATAMAMEVVAAGVRTAVGVAGEVVEAEVKLPPPRKGRRKEGFFCPRLEGIPEECDYCCGLRGEEDEWEVKDIEMEVEEEEEAKLEGVEWAVDAGLWVMCLGVGLLVSSSYYLGSSRKRRGFLF